MREAVILTPIARSKPNGRTYTYWVLRWHDSSGKSHSKSLGPANKVSKRQAEKLRRRKQAELEQNPGRRAASRAPAVGQYLETYFRVREAELAPGTLELHRQTGRYLVAFFGQNRRLDLIQRTDARAFKAALANGELAYVQERRRDLAEATVNLHVRNARRIFGLAMEDDVIPFNPFDRIAGSATPPKAWHEVTDEEFERLLVTARPAWPLLLALARLAGLRRGEALNLRWDQVDWQRSRLTVIANDEWRPKDRDSRVVPVVASLRAILLEAFEQAEPGAERVISPGAINVRNLSRDFTVLCRRAGVQRYAKPFHTLRKTCLTAWSREFPQHVVAAWAGHASTQTTSEYYLQVSEAEYDRAAGRAAPAQTSKATVARLDARPADSRPSHPIMTRGTDSQIRASESLPR